ncbi:MAG: hypothetical protein WCJ35_11490 [Planctomycetota bacterium]
MYMLTMAATVYDGLLSFIGQPICAAFWSGTFVVAGVILGLPLRVSYVRTAWNKRPWIAVLLAITGLALVLYSITPEQMTEYTEGPKRFREAGCTCLPGYVLLIFAIVNLPWRTRCVCQ